MSNQYPQDPNQPYLQQGPQPRLPDPGQSERPQPPKTRKLRTAAIVVGSVLGGLILIGILAPSDPDTSSSPAAVATSPNTGPSPDPVTTPTNKPSKPVAPKTTKPAGTACAGQDDRNAPCTVTVGKPFELGKHTVLSGWKTVDEYGTLSITGKAKNTSGETSTMFIDVKFLKGDDVLAVVSCSTNELEPGQTQALSCFGTDSFTKKYDRVTAEASF